MVFLTSVQISLKRSSKLISECITIKPTQSESIIYQLSIYAQYNIDVLPVNYNSCCSNFLLLYHIKKNSPCNQKVHGRIQLHWIENVDVSGRFKTDIVSSWNTNYPENSVQWNYYLKTGTSAFLLFKTVTEMCNNLRSRHSKTLKKINTTSYNSSGVVYHKI